MRGLRFHLFPHKFEYVRGVGFDVFETFRKTMADLGWVMQIFCDHRMLAGAAPYLREVSRQMPVIVDHLGMVPAIAGVEDLAQTLRAGRSVRRHRCVAERLAS